MPMTTLKVQPHLYLLSPVMHRLLEILTHLHLLSSKAQELKMLMNLHFQSLTTIIGRTLPITRVQKALLVHFMPVLLSARPVTVSQTNTTAICKLMATVPSLPSTAQSGRPKTSPLPTRQPSNSATLYILTVLSS